MAEVMAAAAKRQEDAPAATTVSQVESLFQRRIDFHTARKPSSSLPSADGDFRLETLNPSSTPVRSAASSGRAAAAEAPFPRKRSGEGELYEPGMDPELTFRITFRRIGAGLANLGNTCFLNSVLQCLTYTEPFAAYLQSGKHKSSCNTAGFCAMCALQNHVIAALQSSGKILSPSHLVKNLRCISRNFRNARQEDAHEYMVNLLESMHKCCLPSGVPSESPSAYERSLVHKIFGGRLRSQVKCTQCSYSSSKFDPFLDLSLEINKADSLRKALAHFTTVEQLDGGQRQYQCQRCKEKVRALKQLTIHKAPYVLTIHLKRFGSHIPGQKIDKRVDFEPTLDLKPFVSDEHGGELKYTLYGVLVHAGWSTHSGHYYCYVRTSSGMWHSLDDNQVRQVSEKTVLAQKAYMLFYVRDRSLVRNGSVNMVCKDNISANATNKKLISESSLVSNGVIQKSLIGKKLSISESVSTEWRSYSTTIQSGLAVETSSHKPLAQASCFMPNGGTALHGNKELQTNNQVKRREDCTMQAHGDSFSKESQQTSTKDPIKAPIEKVLQKLNKDSTVEKVPSKATCQNVTPFIPQGGRRDAERSTSSYDNEEVKSGELVAQANSTDSFSPNFQRHENKLVKERDMVKITHDDEHSPEDNLPKKENPILINLPKQLDTAGSFPQKEPCEDGKGHKSLQLKQKKIMTKSGMRFGRNYLFLASLSLRMIKKSKKSKKRHLSSKVSHRVKNNIQSDQGPSTSEVMENIAVVKHSCAKHSHCVQLKENNAQTMRSENNYNGEAFNATSREEGLNNSKNVMNPELPRNCLRSEEQLQAQRVTAGDNVQSQHDFMNLLMGGLKETTVARWDDVELPKLRSNGLEITTSTSIGYVLDEWDEEYDRGKRKKLRKSQPSFDGLNPFQETAKLKAQQKSKSKLEPKRLQNQPLRI
ncbi:ubiquitin carboxyl-terminal hydrolase 23-like [Canna indica]|uniref:Ubiquitin carboxyl-terminal hydrolase n=1 Tax=Canna indica TaxID=4628 RepID=A0AAQ3QQ22_9LILI|nr:ubiquitin carboxyl-terminal hydrolase 23-like [Canna indica]